MGKVNRALPSYAFQLKDTSGSSAGIGDETTENQIIVEGLAANVAELRGLELDKNKEVGAKSKGKEKYAAKSSEKTSSHRAGEILESLSKLPADVQESCNTALVHFSAPSMVPPKKRPTAGDAQVGDARVSKKKKSTNGSVVPVGMDHGFTYRYKKKDKPFVNDMESCANLFRLIMDSSCNLPLINDLVESETYKDLVRTLARASLLFACD